MSGEEDTYQCQECGLHYEDERTAKQCYEYCKEHKACSIEITGQSIEHQKAESD